MTVVSEAGTQAKSGRVAQLPGGDSPRLYVQLARQLLQLIETGTLQPGSRLPAERDLATRFEVSRGTIREATIALEMSGIVEVRTGSGVYILERDGRRQPLQLDDHPGPFEILEARLLVESEVCALAAQRISTQQLESLDVLLTEMEEENRQEAVTEAADQQFHTLIAQAAANSALAASVEWLWGLRNDSAISAHFHERVRREGARPIVADHRAILAALKLGDAQAARLAMQSHLRRVIDHLLELDNHD